MTSRFSAVRECDDQTALCRGLASYLAGLTADAPAGRRIKVHKVLDHYAVPDEHAQYPSICVYSQAAGTYDASRFTPGVSAKHEAAPGVYIMQIADYTVMLTIEIWCTDVVERACLAAAVADKLNPELGKYGLSLPLPFYHGVTGQYDLIAKTYADTGERSQQGLRIAALTVQGTIPYVRAVKLPVAKSTVVRVEATDGSEAGSGQTVLDVEVS